MQQADYTYYITVQNGSGLFEVDDGHVYIKTKYFLDCSDTANITPRLGDEVRTLCATGMIIRENTCYIKIGGAGKKIANTEVVAVMPAIHVAPRCDESVVGRFGDYHVRVLTRGARYGRNDVLTWDEDQPGVEFYKLLKNYDERIDGRGYFISRYYFESINAASGGLMLDGGLDESIGDPDFTLAMQACRDYLAGQDLVA